MLKTAHPCQFPAGRTCAHAKLPASYLFVCIGTRKHVDWTIVLFPAQKRGSSNLF